MERIHRTRDESWEERDKEREREQPARHVEIRVEARERINPWRRATDQDMKIREERGEKGRERERERDSHLRRD